MYYLRAPDVETRQKWVVGLEAVKVRIYIFHLWEISYKCVIVLCFWVLSRDFLNYSWNPEGTHSIHDMGESDEASKCRPKKIHGPEILEPKKYLASKFLTQKRLKYLNMDSFNQTYSSNPHQFELSYFKFPVIGFTLQSLTISSFEFLLC